jgi:hypothetical protein
MPIASIRRIAVAASVAALLAVPTTIATAPTASAQPYPPAGTLFVAPASFQGGPLPYVATGFQANETVTATLDAVVVDTDRANRLGIVTGNGRVPNNTTPGVHTFTVTGNTSGRSLSDTVIIRGRPGRGGAVGGGAPDAAVTLDAAPVAEQVAVAQEEPERDSTAGSRSAVGTAAALAVLGGGTFLLLRRRRAEDRRR